MKSRTKLTPFARFFLFLIIILPLAYVGAAYFNGEDPVAKIKSLVNNTETEEYQAELSTNNSGASSSARELSTLKRENQDLKDKVKKLEDKIKRLEGTTKKWGN